MNARDALFEDRRIPGQVHVHQGRSMLQIEACAASVGGQEHAAGGVVTKSLDQRRPFFRQHAAVEADLAQPTRVDASNDDVVSPRPLRKHHRLGLWHVACRRRSRSPDRQQTSHIRIKNVPSNECVVYLTAANGTVTPF